ncbi:MAG: hypothetical protein Q9227_008390 [Pyrenula ochraceoflavens]
MKPSSLLTTLHFVNAIFALPTHMRRVAGSKRGLIYQSVSDTKPFLNTNPSWAYNFGTSSGGLTGFEFVPQLALASQYNSGAVSNINTAISGGSKYLLGYNEPDIPGQASLSPSQAATDFQQQLNQFSPRIQLGAPAVTSSTGSGQGLSWLSQFATACAGNCHIDFVPLHWAASPSQTGSAAGQAFIAYMTMAISRVNSIFPGKPIWVTEIDASSASNQAANTAFLQTVLPWLNGQGQIARYAYFADVQGNLVSGSSLTQTGQVYASS